MSQVVDAQAVRDRLLRCVQLLGNTALCAIEHTGSLGHEALVGRIQDGLGQATLGIPNAALFPDESLSRTLAFISITKGVIAGLDETAPELEPAEKLAGRMPRSLKVDAEDMKQQSHLIIRFLQELDYELLAKYLNFFDAYYDAACGVAAEKMRARGDSKQE